MRTVRPLLSEFAGRQRWRAVQPYVSGHVLDIGCGWTTWPDYLTPEQVYVGIDRNQAALDYCAQRYPQHQFFRRDLDADRLDLGDRQFDTVILSAVIEHLQVPEHVLTEAHSLLTSSGLLLMTTPSPLGDMLHRLGSKLGLFYTEAVVEHVRIFGRRELFDLVAGCGYEVIEVRPFLLGTNQLIMARRATGRATQGRGHRPVLSTTG